MARKTAQRRQVAFQAVNTAAEILEDRQLLSAVSIDDTTAVASDVVSAPAIPCEYDGEANAAAGSSGASAAGYQSPYIGVPRITSPSGTVQSGQTVFEWTREYQNSSFEVYVYDLDAGQWVIHWQNLTGTQYTSTSPLDAGNYQMWVRAFDYAGNYSAWGAPVNFSVTAPAAAIPGSTTLTGPNGTTADTTPTITWNAAANASKYELFVANVNTGGTAIHETSVNGTSFTPNQNLPAGTYRAWVRGVNSQGQVGNWSVSIDFQVQAAAAQKPGPATLTGPSGSITDSTPTVTWNAAAHATRYELYIFNTGTGTQMLHERSIAGTSHTAPQLQDGAYVAYVRGLNTNGEPGDWSTINFTIAAAPVNNTPPAAPQITGPQASTNDSTPTITWNAVANAARYEVLAYNTAAGQQVMHATNITGTQATPSSAFTAGSYTVYVRGINASGTAGNWSSHSFQVQSQTVQLGVPQVSLPEGGTRSYLYRPKVQWTAVNGAAGYEIHIYDQISGSAVVQTTIAGTQIQSPSALLAGTHQAYVRAVGTDGSKGQWGTLTFDAGDADRILYLNYESITLSASDLDRWSNGEWGRDNNGRLFIDEEADGIRITGLFPNRSDREQLIQAISDKVQEDFRPYGVRVQRHFGGPVENVGASTVFVGTADIRQLTQLGWSGVAASVDQGNDNMTDIAFVQEFNATRDFNNVEGMVNWLAHITAHEAGHTYGLHHVWTADQFNNAATDVMGFGYTVGDLGQFGRFPTWSDVQFRDQTFTEYKNQGHDSFNQFEQQNSFQQLIRNFGGSLSNRRGQNIAAGNGNGNGFAFETEGCFVTDTGEHVHGHDDHGHEDGHDHHHEHDHDHHCNCGACTMTGQADSATSTDAVFAGFTATDRDDAPRRDDAPAQQVVSANRIASYFDNSELSNQYDDAGDEFSAAGDVARVDSLFGEIAADLDLALSLFDGKQE